MWPHRLREREFHRDPSGPRNGPAPPGGRRTKSGVSWMTRQSWTPPNWPRAGAGGIGAMSIEPSGNPPLPVRLVTSAAPPYPVEGPGSHGLTWAPAPKTTRFPIKMILSSSRPGADLNLAVVYRLGSDTDVPRMTRSNARCSAGTVQWSEPPVPRERGHARAGSGPGKRSAG